MTDDEKQPRVGVGAIIFDQDERILLVLRKRAPEAGYWSLPGGKVAYMETVEQAVIREIKEELGVDITIKKLLCVNNHILPSEDAHWVAPTFITTIVNGQVNNMEPDALEGVKWFSREEMPENITLTTKSALQYLPV